jgi:hypothetical protein
MVTKAKFNRNQQSNHPWIPFYGGPDLKTINNRSSVGHNILSFQPNPLTGALNVGLMDKNVTNIKRGVGEFADL